MIFYFGKYKELRAKIWMHTYMLKKIVTILLYCTFLQLFLCRKKQTKKQAKKKEKQKQN